MRSRWSYPVLAFLLGVIVHSESLEYWFTAPDTFALIETSRLASFADLRAILTKPLMYGTSYLNIGLFYRPVANLSYAVDYWVWGLNPFGYHLTNVFLHGFAAALVVVTVRSMTVSSRTGLLTGILFAIHPLSVDTVPAITRRQDILLTVFGLLTLWLFVESLRQEDSRWLRLGAAVAYVLALLSKETAIVLGPLVFLWALLQGPSLRQPRVYWRAVRDVLPLAGVAVVYLLVRVTVLGGIGGYSRSPPLSKMLLIPVEYVLALAYPAHAIGALGDVSLSLLLAFGVGVPIVYLTLLRRELSPQNLSVTRFFLVVVAVVGFGATISMVVFPTTIQSVMIQHVDYVTWYAVGIVFVIATTSAIAAAAPFTQISSVGNRRLDAFFLTWLTIPLPLFFIGKEFLFRSAYFFVVPLLALLATYLVNAVALFEKGRVRRWAGADAALVLVILVLLIPSLVASPLLYTDSGWDAAGDVTEQTLTGVDAEVAEIDGNTPVVVEGVPYRIWYHPKRLGEARERTVLHPFAVRSYLHLRGHENPVTVKRIRSFRTAPHIVSTTANSEGGVLVVSVRYDSRRTLAARH